MIWGHTPMLKMGTNQYKINEQDNLSQHPYLSNIVFKSAVEQCFICIILQRQWISRHKQNSEKKKVSVFTVTIPSKAALGNSSERLQHSCESRRTRVRDISSAQHQLLLTSHDHHLYQEQKKNTDKLSLDERSRNM